MTGREALRMTETEIAAVLEEGSRAQLATYNRDGSIHLVPLAYVMFRGRVTLWTDPSSRKVANLRADPRVTCLVELGEEFESFRAVQLVGRASFLVDHASSKSVGEALFGRELGHLNEDVVAYVANLAEHRVAVSIDPERVVSWDHRKLPRARPDEIGN